LVEAGVVRDTIKTEEKNGSRSNEGKEKSGRRIPAVVLTGESNKARTYANVIGGGRKR